MDYQELLLVTYNQPIVLLCRSTSSEVKYTLSTLSSVMNQDPASISVGLVFLRSNAWNGHDSQICASLLTVELFHDDRIQRIGQEKRGAMIVRTQLNNSSFASFLSQKKEVSRCCFFFFYKKMVLFFLIAVRIFIFNASLVVVVPESTASQDFSMAHSSVVILEVRVRADLLGEKENNKTVKP